MSERDTMFNERDRRCAAVQLMLSTDPSYDNRTIASTLKMQIWIDTNNRDMPSVMKTKFPATVMGFGVVSNEGHIMPPHIFEVGLKVNIKVYLDVLKSMVIPWCNQVASGKPWVWQQDSAPAQAWLQKECYGFVPFPHSSDLNPQDYFVWSYVEKITNMTSHNTKDSLIATIRRVFAELPPALVKKACFQFRIEAVIEAEGGYIEYMLALLHNQVTWIDFFNKSFKIKLQCCFLLDDDFIVPPCNPGTNALRVRSES